MTDWNKEMREISFSFFVTGIISLLVVGSIFSIHDLFSGIFLTGVVFGGSLLIAVTMIGCNIVDPTKRKSYSFSRVCRE